MVDPAASVSSAIILYAGKDVITKFLGPTAEYLGAGMQGLAQRGAENVGKIFKKAATVAGEKLDGPETVNPRILRAVVNEGAFCEDEFTQQYFAGLLVSSLSEKSEDRGVPFAAIVRDMSSDEIKLHYLFYYLLKHVFDGEFENEGLNAKELRRMTMFIPAMSINAIEPNFYKGVGTPYLSQAIFSLVRTGLVDKEFIIGPVEAFQAVYPEAKTGGVLLTPSFSGISLFLFANGEGDVPAGEFLHPELRFKNLIGRTIPLTGQRIPKYFNDGVPPKPE